MLNSKTITDTDLIALVSHSKDIKRAADRICRFADDVGKRVLLVEGQIGHVNSTQAEYLNDQLHIIEATVKALRRRFPEKGIVRVALTL